ncbi:MAG: PIG-L deacetylase family protein [Patescibacteria group bacterium]
MDPKGKKLMTVFAHSDDAEIWAGGSIAKWNALGGESMSVCFCTDSIREKEGISGAKILGSGFKVVKLAPFSNETSIKQVSDLIQEYKPEILITHYLKDTHPEHRNIFELVSLSLVNVKINTGSPKILLCANTYNELCLEDIFNPNLYIDISSYFDRKLEAIGKHKSQPFEMWRKIASDQNVLLGSRLSNVQYAEGFIQIPILGKLANLSLF